MDVGPQNAAGGGEIAVCVNRKAGLEPVQRSVGGFDGLCINRFGVATSVNGLGPQHIGRCEVVRVEGEGQVRSVERGVKLNDVDAGCVDGLVPEGDLHLCTLGNDVVKLQLNDTAVGKVSEVEGEAGVRVVDHSPALRSSLNRAPFATTNWPPSSTVIDEPIAMLMLAFTVKDALLCTMTWPSIAASSSHTSSSEITRSSPP